MQLVTESGEPLVPEPKPEPKKRDYPPDKPLRALTDTDIVTGLRSDDQDTRQAALEALFPTGAGAVLVQAKAQAATITATRRVDAGRVFNALLWLSQNVGAHLGLQLNWIPTQPDPRQIQVAQSLDVPPAPVPH